MNKLFTSLVLSVSMLYTGLATASSECSHNNYGEAMINKSFAEKSKLERRAFKLCYDSFFVYFDPMTKTPLWVAEYLTEDEVSAGKEARTENFMPDPKVPYGAQAKLNDYKGSGFDRGHNAPAANMKNELAMSQSFYLTNMVPQVGPNMNRGIWADLEGKVRSWVSKKGDLDIITGPIFNGEVEKMGKSNVWIPTHMFKIIYSSKTNEAVAYVMPNVQIMTRKSKKVDNGNDEFKQTKMVENCGNVCDINHFMTNVQNVENLTGFVFFTENTKINKKSVNVNAWN